MRLTERPLFYWVLNRFRGLQLFLLVVIVVSLFFRVFPLEMQRKIINVAINLRMLDKLYLYCALYMGAVLIAGLLKYYTNTLQAIIGEKILVGMRRDLYQHILQLPLTFFHRTQAGSIISAITAELNAIGGFLGGALAIPITSVLTFAVFLGYMIYLNPLLGLLSMGIYPVELAVIPLLQRWYNKYNRKRVATTRAMASLVNESVSGIHEVQSNASFKLEQQKLKRLIKRLYKIMVKLSIFKYGIKFSNNLFQSIGPFLLFLVGGYLAIHGEFTIGALIAFLSAYEKVYDPWKEVIEYYQTYQDAQIRYKQIMNLFDHEPQFLLELPKEGSRHLKGEIEAKNVCYQISDTIQLLDDISFTLPSGKHLALIGYSGSGKSTLSKLISQLHKHSSGSLTIDGHEVDELSKTEIADAISSVSQHPFIFTGTVRENLLYSSNALYLNNLRDALPDRQQLIEVVKQVGLEEDLIRWGFRSVIPPQRAASLIPSFLQMRHIIQNTLRDEFAQAIEFYDATQFQQYLPIGVNIIFGNYDGAYSADRLLKIKEFREFLRDIQLETPLTEFGYLIANSTVDLLGDFIEDEFFFQGSPIKTTQFADYKELIRNSDISSLGMLSSRKREKLLALALDFTPGIHKIATLSQKLENDILAARKVFLKKIVSIDIDQCANGMIQQDIVAITEETIDVSQDPTFTPFCINQYISAHSLRDNILFGTVIDRELIRNRLGTIAREAFEGHGLVDDITAIGLDFHVGSKGDNLSGGQKQKIALARALLKKSPIMILDEATASLDNTSQTRIQRYIEENLRGNTTLISVVHRLDMISGYDHILVMKDGKIVESGNYNDLIDQRGVLYDLINDNRE
ncbi:MAG: ABC transporter ATP-binding protein/permease [Desulfobacterales bacterium]|nr:ABC transporter ATP-binding protein/permease [Desulfobacterales bacterium]